MRLWDIYHGEIPELIATVARTESLTRLQDVGMNCGCEYTSFPLFSKIAPYSRFDHSVGVALILWHFTRDPAQAAAGLLHDIATPAFAHVVDFLRGDHMTQESTEDGTRERIWEDEALCRVLKTQGISPEAVADFHQYPIADQDSPRLCADRLEYTLGNSVNYGILTRAQAKAIYDDLMVGENEFGTPELIFRSLEQAEMFAQAALACSKIYVSEPDRYAMEILAELLRDAIRAGILTEADLYLPEPAVIEKLQASTLAARWAQFRQMEALESRETPGEEPGWRQVFAKKRRIDPYIHGQGRASEIFPAFGDSLRAFMESKQNHWLRAEWRDL